MTTANPENDVFYLSRYPIPLTPNEVESYLDRLKSNDEAAKKLIICFIEHRLNHRYIRPLLHIPKEFKSGFLMMATSCLLIEALQSFYDGKNESNDPNDDADDKEKGSEAAFRKFFENKNNKESFNEFREFFPIEPPTKTRRKDRCTFYKHIRCGILHQAETTGGCRILRKGPLFSREAKTIKINANLFVKKLAVCLNKYIECLQTEECSSQLWKMARRKIEFICKNCRT